MAITPEAVTTFERVEGYRIVRSFGYAYGQGSRRATSCGRRSAASVR